MQISDVKHSTLNTMLSVIYNDKMKLEQYGAGINKFFDQHFHLMKHFGQSWPVLGVVITASN